MSEPRYARLTLSLCILAAVLYNSWPLGYILNNYTAHNGLASDLERVGQPYYWLFILGDILSGLCLVIACLIIKLKLRPSIHLRNWSAVYIGIFVFGLGTAIAALVPSHCAVNGTLRCGSTNTSGLGLDAIFSGIAALGLFASLIGVCSLSIFNRLNAGFIRFTWLTLIAWAGSGLMFSVFALSSGKAAEAQFIQQIFLVLCGLAFIVIGVNVDHAVATKPLHEV